MKFQISVLALIALLLMTGCDSEELNLIAYDGLNNKSTIHIVDGKGALTWAVPGEKEPTVIQIESVEALYPEFFGKIISRNHYKLRITGYGSVLSLSRDAGGYSCFECASIHKNLIQVTPPVLWARASNK
ncbi:hypothetical protein [Undibacterium sp. TJN19]|uniref:hypothetical protein n=1 Tax=Undibacterium sp. TJN19 TaxID=3413055 RepID=UPI003BEFFA4A